MITRSRVARTLIAGTALIIIPGSASAKDPVVAQANKVAAESKELQAATNKLDAIVANEQSNDAAATDGTRNQAYSRDDGDPHDRDEDHGKWGLLGLLGLAGLLGLKRRDHDHVRLDPRDGRTESVMGTRSSPGSRTTDTGL